MKKKKRQTEAGDDYACCGESGLKPDVHERHRLKSRKGLCLMAAVIAGWQQQWVQESSRSPRIFRNANSNQARGNASTVMVADIPKDIRISVDPELS